MWMVYSIAVVFLALAMFFLLARHFRVPAAKHISAIRIVQQRPYQVSGHLSTYELLIDKLARPLSRLPWPSNQMEKLRLVLLAAANATPPQLYTGRCIAKSLILFVVTAMTAVVFRPMLMAAIVFPVWLLMDEIKKAERLTAEYRRQIATELPQFVNTICTELSASRDVVGMLKRYLPTAGTAFAGELIITLADMQSGSYETALNRLADRVNLSAMSDVVRGLNGVLHGNDESIYFHMLGYNLKNAEITEAKKRAQRNIPRVNAGSAIILIAVVILYLGILGLDISSGMTQIF